MPTTEHKAKLFITAVEDAAREALGKNQIDKADVELHVEVKVNTSVRSDYPKED